MKTKLILVRHGETDWNYNSRIQGTRDISLNKRGISQANKLADRLAEELIDAIYASNLDRAYTTAEIIADKHNLEVKQKQNLQEINFGIWEGYTFDELKEKYPEGVKKWNAQPDKHGPPEGENLVQLRDRAAAALEDIIDNHLGQTVLVVSHGGVIRTLVSHYLKMPLSDSWQLIQDNTAINILNFYENIVMLERFNCISHL